MIALNRRTNIYVAKGPTDMRASYDTLFLRAKDVLKQEPFSGHLFVFLNGKRTSCKCLYYDGTGLVIIAKRLEKGLFAKMNPYYSGDIILTQAEFNLFFEGADLKKRFIESPSEIRKSAGYQIKKSSNERKDSMASFHHESQTI
jgi:transposase